MAEVVERVAALESRYDSLGIEVGRLRDAMTTLDARMERRFEVFEDRVDRRFERLEGQMRTHFRWTMGGMISAIVTAMAAFLAR